MMQIHVCSSTCVGAHSVGSGDITPEMYVSTGRQVRCDLKPDQRLLMQNNNQDKEIQQTFSSRYRTGS